MRVRALTIAAGVAVVVVGVLALVRGVGAPPATPRRIDNPDPDPVPEPRPAAAVPPGPSLAQVAARAPAHLSRPRRVRTAPVPAPAPAGPMAKPASADPQSQAARIDALVGKALAGPPPEQAPAAAPPAAPELSRAEIDDALKPVAAQIQAGCHAAGPASAIVRMTVEPGGRVSAWRLEGPLSGTAAGDCVQQALTSARFPASAGATFKYVFHLR